MIFHKIREITCTESRCPTAHKSVWEDRKETTELIVKREVLIIYRVYVGHYVYDPPVITELCLEGAFPKQITYTDSDSEQNSSEKSWYHKQEGFYFPPSQGDKVN